MKIRKPKGVARIVAVASLALAALVVAVPAQAQDSEAEIEAVVNDLVAAFNAGDVDGFNAYFTDQGIVEFVEDPSLTPDEARVAVEEFMGPFTIEVLDIRDVEVGDGMASAIVELDFGGFASIDRLEFTDVDGEWLVDGYETGVEQPPQPEIPEGYESVYVEMFDYGFGFDLNELSVGDSVAFEAENTGEEPHELVLVKIPEDLDLEGALESGEQPEGVQDITFTFANPGETGIAVAEDPLEAGRYAMICFVETADGTPHWALGMLEDFTLQAEDTPTEVPATPTPTRAAPEPPATGTGNAQGTGSGNTLALGLGIAIIMLGGAVAARRAVKR